MKIFRKFGTSDVEKMKAKGDINGLIKALGYQKDVNVREAATDALVQIGVPAISSLIDALKHVDDHVRNYASQALGRIGKPATESLANTIKDDGKNPLLWAVENGHNEVATLLLDYGADVNTCDDDGYTALHYAARGQATARGQQAKMAALLLNRGADVNARCNSGMTPLFQTAFDPGSETMLLLIERGADVNARSKVGTTVLDFIHIMAFAMVRVILKRYKMGVLPPGTETDAMISGFMAGKLPLKLEILLEHGAEGNVETMERIRNPLKYLESLERGFIG